MLDSIHKILRQQNVLFHLNAGITVCNVADQETGFVLAKSLLYHGVDKKTVLYLSGGSMRTLYEQLAKEEKIIPGAVGLVDERYGLKFHANSNELMIRESGFYRYLQLRDIPFYPILQVDKAREETAEAYDSTFRSLNAVFQRSVGLVGIGPDGHISSVIPNRQDFHNPWFDASHKNALISEFNDPKSLYRERVGMTFLGLSMLDLLVVLAFGENKKKTLALLFEDGPETEIPARFFKRPEIAKKTLFITDH